MRSLARRLWDDDGGALIAVEWVFVATILILGSITGLVCVRNAIVQSLKEFAEAICCLNKTWHFHGKCGGDEKHRCHCKCHEGDWDDDGDDEHKGCGHHKDHDRDDDRGPI